MKTNKWNWKTDKKLNIQLGQALTINAAQDKDIEYVFIVW